MIAAARARGLEAMTVGRNGETIRLVSAARDRFSSILDLEFGGRRRRLTFPLPGDFQISNALVAAGLCIATGGEADAVFQALQKLRGAPGRLERVGEVRGAAVFVDYAHKPDALEKALQALRPFVRGRLVLAFGCGGDRDPGKRPIMGGIAARLADVAIVTDDNPRSEDPAAIRAEILAAAPSALEIGDRGAAIRAGIAMLGEGDALDHRRQGSRDRPDRRRNHAPVLRRRRSARGIEGGRVTGLWSEDELAAAIRRRPKRADERRRSRRLDRQPDA